MKNLVQLVVDDQRTYNPDLTPTEAIEHVLKTVKLHRTHGTDPVTKAYAAVLRHQRQARFDAREIERHEQDQHH